MRLVGELKKLPGVGERTALRLAFHLLKSPHNLTLLAEALVDVGQARARKPPFLVEVPEEYRQAVCQRKG